MSVFDNIGNKLSNIGGSIKQGATTFTETMQYNSNIERAKKDMKDVYTELGERFFNDNKENVPEQYRDIFARIIEIECYIEATKQAMRELTGARECPNCKAEVQKGQLFCTVCGTRIEDPAPQTGAVYCKNCGQEIQPGFRFCTRCGAKVEDYTTQQKDDSLEQTQPVGYNAAGINNENVQTENVQAENMQAESMQAENVQKEAVQAENAVQAESVQPEEMQGGAVQTENVQTEAVQEQRPEYNFGQAQPEEAQEMSQPESPDVESSVQVPDMDGKIICPHCGAKIKAGTTFCIMCGARLR